MVWPRIAVLLLGWTHKWGYKYRSSPCLLLGCIIISYGTPVHLIKPCQESYLFLSHHTAGDPVMGTNLCCSVFTDDSVLLLLLSSFFGFLPSVESAYSYFHEFFLVAIFLYQHNSLAVLLLSWSWVNHGGRKRRSLNEGTSKVEPVVPRSFNDTS